jgi:hypothetical protein
MTNISNKTFIGSEIKLNINIEPIDSITMEEYDFNVEIYCDAKRSVVIPKSKAIRIDENNYIVRVNTTQIGAGYIKCKITAYIPDEDFDDGLRTEVSIVSTGIEILK